MKNIIKLLFILSLLISFTACEKDKPDLKYNGENFIFFNDAAGSVQESDGLIYNVIVKLAAPAQSSSVTVDFAVETNAIEGEDYELLNESNTLTFEAGSFEDTIKIRSIDNLVEDGSKLITINLQNGGAFNLGYPGPDGNNSIFAFTIIDDDCTFVAENFVGAPSGVEFYPNSEFNTGVTFKLITFDGVIAVYEVTGIMKSVFDGWGEAVDSDPPSGGDIVYFVFDNTDPLAPVISISEAYGQPAIVNGSRNLSTTNGGAWIYDIYMDDSKVSTFSTCALTAEIYYMINVAEPGSDYGANACYLKLDFNN